MTDTSMIERVAEAIWQGEWARAGNGGRRRVPWSEIAEKDQASYRFIARAAIEAMREPTPSMLQPGVWADSEDGASDNPQNIWQDMIDKALES